MKSVNKNSTIENWRFETNFNNEGKTYVNDRTRTQYKGISSWYYKLFKIKSFKQAVKDRFFYLRYTNKLLHTETVKNMFEQDYVQPLSSKYRICYNNKPLYYNESSPSERNFIKWNILSTNKYITPKWIVKYSAIKEPLPNVILEMIIGYYVKIMIKKILKISQL
jgi:virulence-associated protein VapD